MKDAHFHRLSPQWQTIKLQIRSICNAVFSTLILRGKVEWTIITAKLNLERTSLCAF